MNRTCVCHRVTLLIVCLFVPRAGHAWTTIDFEEDVLPPATARPATAVDQSPWVSHGVRFNRDWNTEFDCCPSGWAVSNQTDQSSAGPGSAYSALARSTDGGGVNSSQFAVANNYQQGEATIAFPQPVEVQGVYVTNVTYTYLATVEGNDGAGFVKGPFVEGDWVRLDIIGLDEQRAETGRLPVFLVDYRGGQRAALDEWTWFDLTSLGPNVSSLEFAMSSTDVGPFGMNTPAFFAIDDLTFRAVPEPSGALLSLIAVAVIGVFRGASRRESRRS